MNDYLFCNFYNTEISDNIYQWSPLTPCSSGTKVILANNIEMTLLFGITTAESAGSGEYHGTEFYNGRLYGGQTCAEDGTHNVLGLAIGY